MSFFRDLAALVTSARPARRRELALLLGLLLFSAAADSFSVITLSNFLSTMVQRGSGNVFWAFAAAILIATSARFAANFAAERFSHFAAADLTVAIQQRVLHLPFEQHFSRYSADLLAVPVKVEQLIYGLVLPLLHAIGGMVAALFIIAALVWIDSQSAIIALIVVAGLYGAIGMIVRGRIRAAGRIAAAAYADRIRATQDSVGGLRDLIIDDTRSIHLEHFETIVKQQAKAGLVSAVLASLPRHAGEALGIAAVALLAVLLEARGTHIVAALPVLGAFALAGQRLMPLAQAIFQGWSGAIAGQPLLEEVAVYLSLPPPPKTDDRPEVTPFQDSIELRDVTYRYPDGAGAALERATIRIAKGQYVAVTGPTGSGKSTLVDLVIGLLPPHSGALLVDGREILDGEVRQWQRQIAHVPQKPYLVGGTIKDNITLSYAGAFDRERLHGALRLAGLEDMIVGLPAGVNTAIGEQGVRLSGGQRQRIALARAIYRQTPVLILDEATTALDPASETSIRQALKTLNRLGTTIIVIAHRGDLLTDADLVIRLEAGKPVPGLLMVEPGVEHQDRP